MSLLIGNKKSDPRPTPRHFSLRKTLTLCPSPRPRPLSPVRPSLKRLSCRPPRSPPSSRRARTRYVVRARVFSSRERIIIAIELRDTRRAASRAAVRTRTRDRTLSRAPIERIFTDGSVSPRTHARRPSARADDDEARARAISQRSNPDLPSCLARAASRPRARSVASRASVR